MWIKRKMLFSSISPFSTMFCFQRHFSLCREPLSCYISSRNIKKLNSAFKPVPNHKTLNLSKLKVFVVEKLEICRIFELVCEMVETIMGKGDMLVTSIFLFVHVVFNRLIAHGRKKSWDYKVKG